MEFNNFLLKVEDGIALFTVNRPQVMNALNAEFWAEIGKIAEYVDREDSIKVAIITGSGEKAFISGADINDMRTRTPVSGLQGLGTGSVTKLEKCTKPIIAAINGFAFGGGLEVAMACDIRIASENARFALPELGIGIIPACGGTQRLAKIVGLGRAKDMILTARRLKPEEALQYGLVTQVVPLDKLLETAYEIAKTILSKGPVAARLAKQCINVAMSTDSETGLQMELLSYCVLMASEDRSEGVNAFLEKRQAKFQGK